MIAPKSPVSDSKDCFASKENPSQEISTEGQAPSGELRPLVISDAELSRKVEEALERSVPGNAFTIGVRTALPFLTTSAAAANIFRSSLR